MYNGSLQTLFFFFYNNPPPTKISPLSPPDALPIPTLAFQILAKAHRPYLQNPSAKLLARRHLIIGIGWPRPGREPADDGRQLSQPLDDEIGQAGGLLLAPLPSQPRSHSQPFAPLDVLLHPVSHGNGPPRPDP